MPIIAQRIREERPDIVLINEAKIWRWPFGGGVHQIRELQRLTALVHVHWGNTAATGVAGFKALAVLSRFPLGPVAIHRLPSGYAILRTTLVVGGVVHHVFSLRFNARSEAEQIDGLRRLRSLVLATPPAEAVIAAGDFNCGFGQSYFVNFAKSSRLRHALSERPDEFPCSHDEIDHIFFRGDYVVRRSLYRCSPPNPSDHPWVFAEFQVRPRSPSRLRM